MMSFQARLEKIADALTGISGLNVYHYWRFGVTAPYCIWQEDSESGFEADDIKAEQAINGAIEFFTLTEFDPFCDAIQEALNTAEGVSWYYNGTSYEEETNLIHHSWRWSVL